MTSCTDVAPLFVQRELGVLEEEELDRLESHLDDCKTCPALTARLEGELVAAQVPQESAPEDGWDRLADALARAEDATPLPIRVGLGCTYCHGRVVPESSVYCAACLAPHHGACFEEHGSCCAPGCDETRVVTRREEPSPPPAAPPRNTAGVSWPVVLGLMLGAGVGAAALTQQLHKREVAVAAPTPTTQRTLPTLPTVHLDTYEGKTAEEWIQVLRDHSIELRAKASQALVALGEEAAGPPLRAVLAGDEFVLAWRARRVLLKLNEQEPIPLALYRRALARSNPEHRKEAHDDLETHRSPEAAVMLAKGLRDDVEEVRDYAAQELLERSSTLAPATLVEVERALRDKRAAVRRLAAQTLYEAETPATPALVVALDDRDATVRREVLQALGNVVVDQELPPGLGPAKQLTTRLVRIVRSDPDVRVRVAAAELLAALEPRIPVDAAGLSEVLGDPSPVVRLKVAWALASRDQGAEKAVARLTELVGDHRHANEAIRTLARYGDAARPAVPTLIDALRRSSKIQPRTVGRTLAAAEVPIATLAPLLPRTPKQVTRPYRLWKAALTAARRRADHYAKDAALLSESAMLGLSHAEVRPSATALLLALARLTPEGLAPSLESICQRLGDWNLPMRTSERATLLRAVAHAAAHARKHTTPALAKALRHHERWLAFDAIRLVFRDRPADVAAVTSTLRAQAASGSPATRTATACTLVALRVADAKETAQVERALRFGSTTERGYAVAAVWNAAHPRRVQLLSDRLADRDRWVRGIAADRLRKLDRLPKATIALLRRRLELETHGDVIEAIARVLARHGDAPSLPILRRLSRSLMNEVSKGSLRPRFSRSLMNESSKGGVMFFDRDEPDRRLVGPMVRLGAREPALLNLLRRSLGEKGSITRAATLALAGDGLGLRALERRLADPDPDVRRQVCEALEDVGAKGSSLRKAVRALTNDPWPRVRRAAAKALKAIGG